MYRIMVDGKTFCNSKADELAIINPVVTLEANKAGSFTFTIPPSHPHYDMIEPRTSIVDVMQNDTVLFEGIAVSQNVDFYKQKTIVCEGELTYFNDSIQRPARYQNVTVRQLLSAYIDNHNAQMDEFKQFEVGEVTVTDPNNSIYCYTNYDSTMESFAGDLLNDLGGYFRVRHEDYYLVDNSGNKFIVFDGDETAYLGWGSRVLDYIADSPRTNTQVIRIGKNLLDLVQDKSSVETVTVVIPLGAQLEEQEVEGLDARLTIKSVNGGKDYIEDAAAVATYGRITKVVTWDDVTTADALKRKAEEYLANNKFEKMVINATAFDLSLSEDDFMDFQLLDTVRVVSEPHGLDRNFMITKIVYNLDSPQNNKLTLGNEIKATISSKTASVSGTGKTSLFGNMKNDILEAAKLNATMIMENGGKGYVYFDYDDNAVIRAIMIMDTNDPNTATKRWVWNENGFGYETKTNGVWQYKTAMTMDGSFVADFITSGTLDASKANITNLNASNIKSGTITGIDINGSRFTSDNGTDKFKIVISNGALNVYNQDSINIGRLAAFGSTGSGTYDTLGLAAVKGGDGVAIYRQESDDLYYTAYFMNTGRNPGGRTERHVFYDDAYFFINSLKVSNIGTYKTTSQDSVTVRGTNWTNNWTNLATLELDAGLWIITGYAFGNAPSEYKAIGISSVGGTSYEAGINCPTSGTGLMSITYFMYFDQTTTVYLNGRHGLPQDYTFTNIKFRAIRIK